MNNVPLRADTSDHIGWDILCTSMHEIAKNNYEVAVIPVGAVEAHNQHLPEGQDVLHTTYVARECCKQVWQRTRKITCLPTIPYGVDCNLMEFPLTISISQDTLNAVIKEIIVSLRAHGIKKMVILNGHGGNDFQPFIRQIQCDYDVFVFGCDWWKVARDKYDGIFDRRDDHGGEMETSVALALYPGLVDLDTAGNGLPREIRFEAVNKGWVNTSRDFARVNENCACGDPTLADPEKGRKYLDIVIQRITDFLAELADTPVDENFPFKTDRTPVKY